MILLLVAWMIALAVLAYVPTPIYGADQAVIDKWMDFARTVFATLTGAGAAFFANWKLQDSARIRLEKAAGNFAMATLKRQYVNFLLVRENFKVEAKRTADQYPGQSPWLFYRPIAHSLRNDLEFDFAAVHFLFEAPTGHAAFDALHSAEQNYREAIGALNRLNEATQERQARLVDMGVRPLVAVTTTELFEGLGPLLLGKLQSSYEAFAKKCAKDEAIYLRASAETYPILRERFGSDGLVKVEQMSLPLEEDAPLPRQSLREQST
jgi:hypothetical protein